VVEVLIHCRALTVKMLQYSKNLDMSKCFFLIFAALFPGAYCRICQITSLFLDSPLSAGSNETDSLMYQCPQPGDPHTFTDCCIMDPNDKPRACCEPRNVGFFPGVDDEVLIIVSIGVIAACLLCSIMVLICCFWSRCPLHTACSVNYKHNDDIVFSTKEEKQKLNGMSDEEYGDHKSNPIKIRPVVDV